MDDGIDLGRAPAGLIAIEAEMHGERVECLAAVGDIGDERVHARTVERLQIDIEDVMALGFEPGNHMASGLAGAAGEDDALGHG